MSNSKTLIAQRVAQEVKPDTLVNLGIGLPSLVANHLPPDVYVFFQAENGVIGPGARPPEGMEDPGSDRCGRRGHHGYSRRGFDRPCDELWSDPGRTSGFDGSGRPAGG